MNRATRVSHGRTGGRQIAERGAGFRFTGDFRRVDRGTSQAMLAITSSMGVGTASWRGVALAGPVRAFNLDGSVDGQVARMAFVADGAFYALDARTGTVAQLEHDELQVREPARPCARALIRARAHGQKARDTLRHLDARHQAAASRRALKLHDLDYERQGGCRVCVSCLH